MSGTARRVIGLAGAAMIAALLGWHAAAQPPLACDAAALCAGPGQAYATLGSALAAARAGDVIEIVAGLYREPMRIARANVTVRGVGGRPLLDCAGQRLVANKSCVLVAANGVTIENLEISGATVPPELGDNGSCIRNEPNDSFTVRGVVCHGSQEGILSSGGTILIENSEFYDNGWNGLTHNVYFGGACIVTVRGSTFRDARIGHEFKSRCDKTTITGSTFRSTRGSRDIDIPDGGETLIEGSTLVKLPGTDNDEIVGFTAESCRKPGDMVLRQVRIINSAPEADIRNYDRCDGRAIFLEGVTFEGNPVALNGKILWR